MQTLQGLNGLMRWAILSQANGIVGENVNDSHLAESADANRCSTVSEKGQKGQKGGAIMSHSTVGEKSY